jgi:hypothetical protein
MAGWKVDHWWVLYESGTLEQSRHIKISSKEVRLYLLNLLVETIDFHPKC